jgi:hypothetical protein
MLKTLVAALVGALALSGVAVAASHSETYKFSSKLTAGAEVPKPTGVPGSATGRFTVTTVEPKTGMVRLTWKLTFSHLSGKATAAHIHLGRKGKAGGVLVALCGPCRSGQTGKAVIARSVEGNLEAGKTYVNVHTNKNPGGEIRGQIKETHG